MKHNSIIENADSITHIMQIQSHMILQVLSNMKPRTKPNIFSSHDDITDTAGLTQDHYRHYSLFHSLFIDLSHSSLHQLRFTLQLQRETPLPFEHPFSDVWNIISIATTDFHYFLHTTMESQENSI